MGDYSPRIPVLRVSLAMTDYLFVTGFVTIGFERSICELTSCVLNNRLPLFHSMRLSSFTIHSISCELIAFLAILVLQHDVKARGLSLSSWLE